ncbi:hypothetical protein DBK22_00846 [Bacillus velezensis]|nr:hypothetical protein DBK22_00846 [Bacillus velezensis]
MTPKPLKECASVVAVLFTRDRYCEAHKTQQQEETKHYNKNSRNKTTTSFYKSTAWKRTRQLALIRDNYLCQHCLKDHCFTPADMVHHIVEVKQDWSKRLDMKNLESCVTSVTTRLTAARASDPLPNKSLKGKRTENSDPPSANKHRFSKFRKQQKASSANLPRGLGTTLLISSYHEGMKSSLNERAFFI